MSKIFRRPLALALGLFGIALALSSAPSETTISPVPLLGSAEWKTQLLAWRVDREKRLSRPDGWLTLVGLDWIKPGANSLGTAASSSIRLPAQHAGTGAERLGSLELQSSATHDLIVLRPPSSGFPAGLRENDALPQEGPISFDPAHPTVLSSGSLKMIVIERGGRYAVRTKDSESPTRTHFRGLHWYAPDPRYVIRAHWTPYTSAHILHIPTVLGTTDQMATPGFVEFTMNGRIVHAEPVLEEPNAQELFFILRDATARTTTDGAARFLYTSLPDHGLAKPGTLLIDFNKLENPPCAFTPYATCPLPPPGNRLSVALPVGELRYTP